MQKGAAIFDIKKLDWMNSHYIKEKSGNELLMLLEKLYGKESVGDKNLALKILDIGKMRMEKLEDFKILKESFDLVNYDTKLLIFQKNKKLFKDKNWLKYSLEESVKRNLSEVNNILRNISVQNFNKVFLEQKLMPFADKQSYGRGEVLWPLRVALSGKEKSPGPFEIMHVIGKEESLKRIEIASEKLKSVLG